MPKWIVPKLTKLAYLNTNLIEILDKDLCILGEMPALLSLVLTFKGVEKERIIIRSHVFPCLKEFWLFTSPSGTRAAYLKFEEGALPKLEKLEMPFFVSVAKAYGFKLGINHLPGLKHAYITMRGCNAAESKDAVAAIMNEANAHPNHPKVFVNQMYHGLLEGNVIDEEELEEETYTNEEELEEESYTDEEDY